MSVDQRILSMAIHHFSLSGTDKSIQPLLTKTKLTDAEREKLLTFIETSQRLKPLSMGDMKREILRFIGHPEDYNFKSNTTSSAEMASIYAYFKQHFFKKEQKNG